MVLNKMKKFEIEFKNIASSNKESKFKTVSSKDAKAAGRDFEMQHDWAMVVSVKPVNGAK